MRVPAIRALSVGAKIAGTPLARVLTGAPSEWKMRNRVAALVSANPSIWRDGHCVRAAGRPERDPAARQVPGDSDGPQGEAPVPASQSACQ